jgi:hypothetical protein
MIARNEVASDIGNDLGQTVLKRKAKVSYDCGHLGFHNWNMAERLTDTEEKLAFIRRVRTARLARFGDEGQKPICVILGVPQSTYKQYEKRTPLPHRYIPKFCAATGVSLEWLLTGEGKGPPPDNFPKETPKRTRKARLAKAA